MNDKKLPIVENMYDALNAAHETDRGNLLQEITQPEELRERDNHQNTAYESLRIEVALAIVGLVAVVLFNVLPRIGPSPRSSSRQVASHSTHPSTASNDSSGIETERLPASGSVKSGERRSGLHDGHEIVARESGSQNNSSGAEKPLRQKSKFVTAFEQHPYTLPIVAENAPVFVLFGPAQPAELGSVVTAEELREVRRANEAQKKLTEWKLHRWNWTQSSVSNIASVPMLPGQLALHPTGKYLLHASGTVVDVNSGETRRANGFTPPKGSRVWKLKYSPTGRYVLAWLLKNRGRVSTIRIIDMTQEKVVAELAGGRFATFTPTEAALIYSSPDLNQPRTDTIERYDLSPTQHTSEPQRASYQPSYINAAQLTSGDKVMETVGMCTSPDGKYLAVSYSYGKVFIWNLTTGKLVSHSKLTRNGKRDHFFTGRIMRFSPDGMILAMASNNRLALVRVADGKQIASHHDASTPPFVHLRWLNGSKILQLLSYSSIEEFRSTSGFESVHSEKLPRLYRWNWQATSAKLELSIATE